MCHDLFYRKGKKNSLHQLKEKNNFFLLKYTHTERFYNQMCRGFFHITSSAVFPIIQFSFETIYLELATDPTSKGFSPTRLPPTSDSKTSPRLPPLLLTSCKLEVPITPLLGFNNLLEWLTNLRATPIYIYSLL